MPSETPSPVKPETKKQLQNKILKMGNATEDKGILGRGHFNLIKQGRIKMNTSKLKCMRHYNSAQTRHRIQFELNGTIKMA